MTDTNDDVLPMLAGSLAALDEPGRQALLAAGTWRRFEAGETLMEQGETADDVHLVAQGRVRIVLHRPDDHDVLLAVRGPGSALGDVSLLEGSRRSATVLALDEVHALTVPGPAFLDVLRTQPDVLISLLQTMAKRLREAERRLVEHGTRSVHTRLARRLLELAVGAVQVDGDAVRVEVPLSRAELASWVGATPNDVEQALDQLRRNRLIADRRDGLAILDVDGLRVAARM